MDAKYSLSPFDIRFFHRNLTVKSSRTEQRRVKDVRTVCRRKDYKSFFVFKAVHLDQKLVQSLLPLVVSAAESVYSAFSKRIDFVDKDNARSFFPCLPEKVSHAACAHANEHFYKIRTGNAEKRNSSLACHRTGKQCLTSSRRTYKQNPLRNLSAYFSIFFRRFKKIHDFHKFVLCLVHASDIAKSSLYLAFFHSLCSSAADSKKASHSAAVSAAHLSEYEKIHEEYNSERNQKIHEKLQQIIVGFCDEFVVNAFFVKKFHKT